MPVARPILSALLPLAVLVTPLHGQSAGADTLLRPGARIQAGLSCPGVCRTATGTLRELRRDALVLGDGVVVPFDLMERLEVATGKRRWAGAGQGALTGLGVGVTGGAVAGAVMWAVGAGDLIYAVIGALWGAGVGLVVGPPVGAVAGAFLAPDVWTAVPVPRAPSTGGR